nr:MAG TPA: hypothetical protein [Caudoviricetes sp.]
MPVKSDSPGVRLSCLPWSRKSPDALDQRSTEDLQRPDQNNCPGTVPLPERSPRYSNGSA